MSKLVHNIETDEVYSVELTEEEVAHAAEMDAQRDIDADKNFAEISNTEALKASALAKLTSLGLTEDEARAIVGI